MELAPFVGHKLNAGWRVLPGVCFQGNVIVFQDEPVSHIVGNQGQFHPFSALNANDARGVLKGTGVDGDFTGTSNFCGAHRW